MSHGRAKRSIKGLKNGNQVQKIQLLCWVSVLLFFYSVYDEWMWMSIKSESLWGFYVASVWMGSGLTLNKASFSLPGDDCVKRLTYLRNAPRLLCTHSFSWHTFSCSPSLSGIHGRAASHRLIFIIIFATYFASGQSMNWLKERKLREVNPHEHVVLT